jgi:hypothetical protein
MRLAIDTFITITITITITILTQRWEKAVADIPFNDIMIIVAIIITIPATKTRHHQPNHHMPYHDNYCQNQNPHHP